MFKETDMGRGRETGIGAALLGLFLVGVFFLGTAQADPNFKAEYAAGQCRYQKSPDGMWWQHDHENASRYKDNDCSEIGLGWKLNERYGMSLRWVNLGHITTSARANDCDDSGCAIADKSLMFRPECATQDQPNCVKLWTGGGGIHGINLSVNTELARVGQVSLDGEVGVLVYEMYWVTVVTPIQCVNRDACAWRRATDTQASGLYMSPMGALTLRWKDFFIASRIYTRTTEHTSISPGFSGYVQTWMAGVQIKF